MMTACSEKNAMTPLELKTFIEQHLGVGDPAEKIEFFLQKQNWPYSYDHFAQRYQTGYPEGEVNTWYRKKGIAIWIYVDDEKKYKSIEVNEIYTGL